MHRLLRRWISNIDFGLVEGSNSGIIILVEEVGPSVTGSEIAMLEIAYCPAFVISASW